MKSAKYEPSPGALISWLASKPRAVWMADLYTFSLIANGPVLAYTTFDANVTIPYATPVTYDSTTALFDNFQSKSTGHWKVGVDVDTWTVVMTPRPGAYIGSMPWLSAVVGGLLDGSVATVDRAFWDAPPSQGGVLRGVLNIFTGRVAETITSRSTCQVNINSHMELLTNAIPRTLAQATCRWALYSSGCGLSSAAWGQTGAAASGSSANVVLSAPNSALDAPGGSGTYALGRLTFVSGANSGISRSVRRWAPGTFTLLSKFPNIPAAGDSFIAFPGCDKSVTTCNAFYNVTNFGGMPFIPAPETSGGA